MWQQGVTCSPLQYALYTRRCAVRRGASSPPARRILSAPPTGNHVAKKRPHHEYQPPPTQRGPPPRRTWRLHPHTRCPTPAAQCTVLAPTTLKATAARTPGLARAPPHTVVTDLSHILSLSLSPPPSSRFLMDSFRLRSESLQQLHFTAL